MSCAYSGRGYSCLFFLIFDLLDVITESFISDHNSPSLDSLSIGDSCCRRRKYPDKSEIMRCRIQGIRSCFGRTGSVNTSQFLFKRQQMEFLLLKIIECIPHSGDMNNVMFGDETMGYYETIGGGAGAGKV